MHIEQGSALHFAVAASGAVPAIVAMLYFDWLDRKRPEPWGLRYGVMAVGILSVIPALIYDLVLMGVSHVSPDPTTYAAAAFNSYGTAAAIEEASKISAVFMVVWYSKSFDERMDGLVYGARAGLGFALVENILYIWSAAPTDQLAVTWVVRALLAVPGHALWSGMLGYCAARRKFDRAGPGILGGYLLAVFFHGSYDFSVFVQVPLRAAGQATIANALIAVPLVLTIAGWITVRKMARTALRLDDAAEAERAQRPPMQVPVMQQQYWYWPGPPRG